MKYKDDPTAYRKTSKRRASNRATAWRLALKAYGLTQIGYDALVVAQENSCAICKGSPQAQQRGDPKLHIDHDHVTGKIRGLLCRNCNTALGLMHDSPTVIDAAAKYLRRQN